MGRRGVLEQGAIWLTLTALFLLRLFFSFLSLFCLIFVVVGLIFPHFACFLCTFGLIFGWEIAGQQGLVHGREYTEEELWGHYEYFIKKLAPVAGKYTHQQPAVCLSSKSRAGFLTDCLC